MSLADHLLRGTTTVARAWAVQRRDGVVLGFTDHDRDLAFEGILFQAGTGMTAAALEQTTGLGIDNSEAAGALSAAAITEGDILAGKYDGARVSLWWVNWANVAERQLRFRGSLGEVTRVGGAFRAELRGLSEPLNRPQGRVYQAGCSAILGDPACGVDLGRPEFFATGEVIEVGPDADLLRLSVSGAHAPGWFAKGRLEVLGGAAAGLSGLIKDDHPSGETRVIVLWQRLGYDPRPGDPVRLSAGCDKCAETCRTKFGNILNFRGFPNIPGEDWMLVSPREGDLHDGGSLRR